MPRRIVRALQETRTVTTHRRWPAPTATTLALAALALAASTAARADDKPNEYDAAALATPAQLDAQAKKYWKGQGLRKIREAGYRKAAIVEFSIEYVTLSKSDWSGHGGFGLLDVAQAASGAGKRRLEIEPDLKARLPRELHDAFREQMVAEGYEVKTLDEVVASPAFAELKGSAEPGKAKSRDEHYAGADKTEKAEVYPVESLMNLKMGAFAAASNVETLARLGHDLGVDVVVRAHFRVGVIKGGRPTLEDGSWIWVGAGPQQSGERYSFSQFGQIGAKDGLVYDKDVTDAKDHQGAKGTVMVVSSDAYREALLTMYPAFAGMGLSLLDAE